MSSVRNPRDVAQWVNNYENKHRYIETHRADDDRIIGMHNDSNEAPQLEIWPSGDMYLRTNSMEPEVEWRPIDPENVDSASRLAFVYSDTSLSPHLSVFGTGGGSGVCIGPAVENSIRTYY